MWDAGHQGPAVDSLDYGLVCGSSRFVERLREKMNDCWDYGENNWERGKEHYSWIKYKLLACEYL